MGKISERGKNVIKSPIVRDRKSAEEKKSYSKNMSTAFFPADKFLKLIKLYFKLEQRVFFTRELFKQFVFFFFLFRVMSDAISFASNYSFSRVSAFKTGGFVFCIERFALCTEAREIGRVGARTV